MSVYFFLKFSQIIKAFVLLTLMWILFCRIEIAAEPRLKKLRDSEDETVVSGKKFTQKLKKQWV